MKEILLKLDQAIADEVRAQKHYQELKEAAVDSVSRSVFEQLRRDEEEHERLLRARYQALEKVLGDD